MLPPRTSQLLPVGPFNNAATGTRKFLTDQHRPRSVVGVRVVCGEELGGGFDQLVSLYGAINLFEFSLTLSGVDMKTLVSAVPLRRLCQEALLAASPTYGAPNVIFPLRLPELVDPGASWVAYHGVATLGFNNVGIGVELFFDDLG